MKKKHAMTSEAASEKKMKGHKQEQILSDKIGGQISKKKTKCDIEIIINNNLVKISLKAAEKKSQIFLYRKNSSWCDLFDNLTKQCLSDCLNILPDNRNDYIKDKIKYKSLLSPEMEILKYTLSIKNKLINFIDVSFFNNQANTMIVYDYKTNIYYILKREQFIENMCKFITHVKNSRGKIPSQKVIFKNPKGTTLGEIELRNDSPEHYKEVKFWIHQKDLLEIMKSSIQHKKGTLDQILPLLQQMF